MIQSITGRMGESSHALAVGNVDAGLGQCAALGRNHNSVRQRLVGGNNFGLQPTFAGSTAAEIGLHQGSGRPLFNFRVFAALAAVGVVLRLSCSGG